jgi:hypothetical protein
MSFIEARTKNGASCTALETLALNPKAGTTGGKKILRLIPVT